MPINFKLGDRRKVEPLEDPMSRSWIGWSEELSDQNIYDQNRGVWFLGRRARTQKVATFSHNGKVVAVVSIEHVDEIPARGIHKAKQAIRGQVLKPGDRDYEDLIGMSVDAHRNPVTYLATGVRTCACGCGADVAGNRVFLPGHDQRAIHDRIAQEWGTTLKFIEWFDDIYGNPNDENSGLEAATSRTRATQPIASS
jgi:hypothetical protein